MKNLNTNPTNESNDRNKRYNEQLSQLIGTVPNESPAIKRIRKHQGWWRAVVIGLPEGQYFDKKNNVWIKVCNRLDEQSAKPGLNFLTDEAKRAAEITLSERGKSKQGMIEETRLNYNLLSSQPLCFNFFGELMLDRAFGLQVLQLWWPEISELKRVIFEYAPPEKYTNDNSAFDIAFEVSMGDQVGLIGLECKYTDTFSATPYHKTEYENIYNASNAFAATYEELKLANYNQLFRNQLIAEALVQNKNYAFVKTGLFCYQDDNSAIQTADKFKLMLSDPESFKTITYNNFIESVQRLDLNWRQREWTMLLCKILRLCVK